jgi:hypothetical protein
MDSNIDFPSAYAVFVPLRYPCSLFSGAFLSRETELFYVTCSTFVLFIPHISMLFYTAEIQKTGCTKSFVTLPAGVAFNDQQCAIALYAFWLLLLLITIIHTATITFPVGLTLAQGSLKLQESHIITEVNYKGPKLLTSFESAVSNKICAKYFRRYLAYEFTLDNMRILVDIEEFKTKLDPTYIGILKSNGYTNNYNNSHNSSQSSSTSLARGCHTITAWQAFSGNLPITLLANVNSRMFIHRSKLDVSTLHDVLTSARNIVKKYFSNEFWCNLYDVKEIKNLFLSIYNALVSITDTLEKLEKKQNSSSSPGSPSGSGLSGNTKIHENKLLRKLFVVFDDVLDLVYKSLVHKSYPKFVQSNIGVDLRNRLNMGVF